MESICARDQPLRLLYGTPQFVAWLRDVLDGTQPARRLGHTSISEQVDDLFSSFLSGQQLIFTKQFRVVRAEENSVRELKNPMCVPSDGSWPRIASLRFSEIGLPIKDHDLYRGYRIAIRWLRRNWGSMKHYV